MFCELEQRRRGSGADLHASRSIGCSEPKIADAALWTNVGLSHQHLFTCRKLVRSSDDLFHNRQFVFITR